MAIGVPDEYRGQSPKLFVTLRPGASATAAEILAFLKEHLNKIECPKTVEIRESLPKTLVGKLSKKELVAEERKRETTRKASGRKQPLFEKSGAKIFSTLGRGCVASTAQSPA